MKELIKKSISILVIMMLMINSSLLLVISEAIDTVENVIDESKINGILETNLEKYVNYKTTNEQGLMVQTNLKTGIEYLEGQEYKSLNSTGIIVNSPKVNEEYPEKVEVVAKSTKSTNGDENGKDSEFTYDNKTGEIKIATLNIADENGNIYSENVKDARDEYQVVLYYSANCYDANNVKRNLDFSGYAQFNIANDNETKIKKDFTQCLEVTENISGLVSTNVTTSDIYNGYINSNNQNGTTLRTEYLENIKLQVSYKEISDEININTKNLFINSKDEEKETQDIIYKNTKINKNEILDKLGEDGYLKIIDKDGNVLGEVNKNTQADENGIVEINYENEISELTIKISKPMKIADIDIQNTKQIKETMKDIDNKKIEVKAEISCVNNIKETTKVVDEVTKEEKEVVNEKQEEVYNVENKNTVEIRQAVTDVELSIDNNKWTNNVQNDITFTATLITESEKYNLFENPVIEIKLPSEVEKVILGNASILYDNQLSIKNVETVDKNNCKTIRIELNGKQTGYNQGTLVKGVNVLIPASVILKKDISSVDSNVEVTARNQKDNDTKQFNIPIKIESITNEDTQVKDPVIFSIDNSTYTENVDLSKISIDYTAEIGDKQLNNEDVVHEGEYIKYTAKIKNNSGANVSGINVISTIPDGTTYVDVVNKELTAEEVFQHIYDESHIIENVDLKEYSKEIELGINEEKEISFYVKINNLSETETEKEIISNIKVKNGENENTGDEVKNIVHKAEITVNLAGWETQRGVNIWALNIYVTNNKTESLNNINVDLDIGDKFILSNDTENIENTENTENIAIEEENNHLKFKIDSIAVEETVTKTIFVKAHTTQEEKTQAEIRASLVADNTDKYYANPNIQNIKSPVLEIIQTSDKEGEKLKYGEEVEYVFTIKNKSKTINKYNINFYDYLDDNMKTISAEYENFIIDDSSEYAEAHKEIFIKDLKDKEVSNAEDYDKVEDANLLLYIPNGEQITIKIKATPRMLFQKEETNNYAIIEYKYNGTFTKTSNSIKNIILPYDYKEETTDPDTPIDPDVPINPDDPTNPDNPSNPNNPGGQEQKYSISGIVWNDENKSGTRESSETTISGITVKLFDIDTNSIVAINNEKQIKATDNNGKYEFTQLPKGNYIVLFEYDTNAYKLTTYQVDGINDSINSDVINKTVNIDGVEKLVAITNTLNVSTSSYSNIDMGLIKHKKFDFSLNKTITNVSVKYSDETKEYNFKDTKLAKVEIPAKKISGTTITIEYKFEVKNEGEANAIVDAISDKKPEGLDFDEKLNSGWSIDADNNIKYLGLKGQALDSGKSKIVTLYLTKTLSKDTIGTFTNKAKIFKSTNLEASDSTNYSEGKDDNLDNNSSEAKIIISVKTGALLYTGIIIFAIIILLALRFLISKKIIKINGMKTIFHVLILGIILASITAPSIVKAEQCWDSSDQTYQGNVGLSQYLYNSKYYWTHNYYTHNYNGHGINDVPYGYLYCTDGLGMGFMNRNGTGQKFTYNYSYYTDYVETAGTSTSSGVAEISEVSIPNKASTVVKNGDYCLIGPFETQFNGAINYFSVEYKNMNDQIANVSNPKLCNSNRQEIDKSALQSKQEFYIKVKIDSNIKQITRIILGNKTQKTVTTNYTYTYSEVWLSNDSDGKEKAQVLKKKVAGSGKHAIPTNSVDTVDIAVNKSIVGNIKIIKKDTDTAAALSGTEFTVTGPLSYNKKFTTDANGAISITNLPLGDYTITESGAPSGYNLNLQTSKTQTTTVEAAQTKTHNFVNRKYGNLQIIKKDTSTDKVIQEAGFSFYVYRKTAAGTKEYISTYSEGSPSIITYTTTGTKYKLITGTDGKTQTLMNIPINDTYYIEEVEVPDSLKDYYEVTKDDGTRKVVLNNNFTANPATTVFNFYNKQIYTDVSGLVWEDIAEKGKENLRNNLYDKGIDKLVATANGTQGITVRLKDIKNNVIFTTTTDVNGQYRFKKVIIEKLEDYYIEFEYNGLKYESVKTNLTASNGSKAVENSTNRTNFNKSYSTIIPGTAKSTNTITGYSVDANGKNSNTLTYKNGTYSSSLVDNTQYTPESASQSIKSQNGSAGVTMIATTTDAKMKLTWVAGSKDIASINFGIYQREQPDLAIATDINTMNMTINGYNHTYNFGQRASYIKNGLPDTELNAAYNSVLDGFSVAVKNGSGNYKNMTYTRGIYDSYIAYTKDNPNNEDKLKVYITYKLVIKNESSVAFVKVKSLRNYADTQLNFIDSYIEGSNTKVTWKNVGNTTDSTHKIWESGEIATYIAPGENTTVYLTYELSTEAIVSLANLQSDGANDSARILSNTTEIYSYSSYDTNKNEYAGIDKDSAPGNITYGNIATYEDDTDSAPELKIKRENPKAIAGLVFEDEAKVLSTKERIGDGTYSNGNKVVNGVQVKLVKYNTTNAAYLYTLGNNGQVVKTTAAATTANDGKYNFIGIIPGEYVVQYKYGTASDLQSKIGSINVTTQDYKSTIMTNDKLKQAVKQNSEYWYQDTALSNYSSALDDWEARKTINNNLKNVTYSVKNNYDTIKDSVTNHSMLASTGKMNFAIEDTNNQTTNYNYAQPSRTYNIKFGIAERPRQSLELTKEISYIKLTLTNGQVLVEGDPRKGGMNYVTYPQNGLLKIEADNEIIQGAKLEISYSISIENKSETNYNTENYYKYGIIDKTDKPVQLTIDSVIDYADEDLTTVYTNNGTNGQWLLKTANDVKNLLSTNAYNSITNRKNILVNNCAIVLSRGEKKSLSDLQVSKLISTSEDLTYDNYAEVLGASNNVGRFYGENKTDGTWVKMTPGNLVVTNLKATHEADDNATSKRAELTIIPPTGVNDNVIYYVIGISSLLIIIGGIVIIKKKVL